LLHSSWRTLRNWCLNGQPISPSTSSITWMTLLSSSPHHPIRLRDFINHLNSVHQNIQFTMERERYGLDLLTASCCFLAWCTILSRSWRWHCPLKCWLTFTGLHGVLRR
jgi:hypothetical protein